MAADGYILAVDYGDKRVGLAIGHTIARLPEPLCTLTNGPTLIDDIMTATAQQGLKGLVVGLPRNMDGSLGLQAEKCQAFGDELGRRLGLPVIYTEETLSSVEAAAYLRRTSTTKAGLDAVAAACILGRYFSDTEVQR